VNLVDRAVKMLTTPKTEWEVVAAESATPQQVLVGYVVPLTLLAQLAGFIGAAFVGAMMASAFGIHHGAAFWLASAVVGWAASLAVVWVEAWVVNALAPTFGSVPNFTNAFKLVAFSATAAWVGCLLAVVPVLGMLGGLAGALYSIYLFYLGVPRLMSTPQDKVASYMIITAIVILVLWGLTGAVVAGVTTVVFGAVLRGM
jgi:hypothetical protein